MARSFKIDQCLKPEHRREFEAMALDSLVSLDKLKLWLSKHGCKVSRGAVEHWRSDFRAVAADPIRHLRRYLSLQIEAMPIDQLKAVCQCVNGLETGQNGSCSV